MSDHQLDFLVLSLIDVKQKEAKAREVRIHVEEQIAALVETPEEGQKTVTLTDGVKLTVKRGLRYTADLDAIREVLRDQDVPVPISQKTTYSLDEKGYRWFKENIPAKFALITPHVFVKPAKVAVTVKLPKEG